MSDTAPAMIGPLRKARTADGAAFVGLVVAMFLLFWGGNLAGNGVLPLADVSAAALPGWESGSLMRVLAAWAASWAAPVLGQGTALMLAYALAAGLAGVVAYRFLRVSDWPALQALLAIGLVASNGLVLYAVTTASNDLALFVGVAALVPAMRRLESVGDVQSVINYGLTLPLLLMAGPPLAALIVPLALAVPLREPEARRRPQVFAAMVLVGFIPTLIIVAGVTAMAVRAGLGFDVLTAPFGAAFAPVWRPMLPSLLLMPAVASVGLLPILHSLIPDRRRQVISSMGVVLLPVYLAIGRAFFDWQISAWAPAGAMIVAVLAWLCASRIRAWMRWLALALLLLSALASWALAGAWADPAWLDGLWPAQFYDF